MFAGICRVNCVKKIAVAAVSLIYGLVTVELRSPVGLLFASSWVRKLEAGVRGTS